MSRRLTLGFCSAALVVGTAVLSWNWVQAQTTRTEALRPEALLPVTTVAYLRHEGTANQKAAWEQTAAYESLVKSGLVKSLDDCLGELTAVRPELDVIRPLIWNAFEQGFTLGVSLQNSGEPEVYGVLVLHRSGKLLDDISKLARAADAPVKMRRMEGREVTTLAVDPANGVEISLFVEGESLVCGMGRSVAEKILAVAAGRTPNITAHPQWKTWTAPTDTKVLAGVGWMDFAAIRKQLENLPLADGQGGLTNNVAGFIKLLGLDTLEEAVSRQSYDGRRCVLTTELKTSGAPRGLMSMFVAPTMTLEDLPPLPRNVSSVFAMSLDWLKIHDEVLAGIREATKAYGPPEAADQLEGQLAMLDDVLGFSLRDDLAAALGNVHTMYGDPSNGFAGMGLGLAIGVKDPEKIQKVVDAVLRQIPFGGPGVPQLMQSQKHGRDLSSFGQPGVPMWPTICVDKAWLVAGLTPQTVESFLMRVDGKLDSWTATEDQQAALKTVPERFLSLTLNDPRQSLQGLSQGMAMVQGMMAAAPANQPRFPLPELPPTELITEPLFPNVSVCEATANGFTWHSSQSLPAIPLMGSFDGPSLGTSAVLVALLLPAVQQARIAARRTQSRNNLKQLGLALHNFHDKNNAFPAGALPGKGEADERQSWMVAILPYMDEKDLFGKIAKDEAWNSDTNKPFNARTMPLYQNPNQTSPAEFQGGYTDYVGIAGLGKDGPTLPVTDKKAGVFGYNRAASVRDIKDGASNTLMTGEVATNRGPWMQGGPSTIRPLDKQPYVNGADGFGGNWVGGCHFGMADGSVRFVSEVIHPTLLENLATIAGGEAVGEF